MLQSFHCIFLVEIVIGPTVSLVSVIKINWTSNRCLHLLLTTANTNWDQTQLNIVTVRKRSRGKVMFLHLSISHSIHRGGVWPMHAGIHHPPPPDGQAPSSTDAPDGHCSGRYPSYWNFILF